MEEKNTPGQKVAKAIIVLIVLLAIVLAIRFVFQKSLNREAVDNNAQEQIIGGDKDEGGCLVGAGYSWCELKQKCLRIWEEPCIDSGVQSRVEAYLKEHISELSPEKEVLGGKFYITQFHFIDDQHVDVDYEDGHIALSASVLFTVDGEEVTIQKFSLTSSNGSSPENAGNSNIAIVELTRLFAAKYQADPSNIVIQINDDRGTYLRGNVKFSLDEQATGGYFLARMVNGQYEIVVDGNGQIDCALVTDFPSDMVQDCSVR